MENDKVIIINPPNGKVHLIWVLSLLIVISLGGIFCFLNKKEEVKRNIFGKVERGVDEYKITKVERVRRIGINDSTYLQNTKTGERIIVNGNLGQVGEVIKYQP